MATKKFLTKYDKIDGKEYSQKFDQDVKFKRQGKEIKINDFVQENAVGTNFYENLEQFGNLETTIKFMSVNRAELVADFKEATSLKDLEDRRNKLMTIWNRLPAELRGQFDSKFENFMNNGAAFFDKQAEIINEQKNRIHKEQPKQEAGTPKQEAEQPKKE